MSKSQRDPVREQFCQPFAITPWTWLRDTLTQLPTTPPDQVGTLLHIPTK